MGKLNMNKLIIVPALALSTFSVRAGDDVQQTPKIHKTQTVTPARHVERRENRKQDFVYTAAFPVIRLPWAPNAPGD
jgi:hypothetical protein